MLVLTRKEGEKIRIGDDIVISVVRVTGDKVRIGIEAPAALTVLREELRDRDRAARTEFGPMVGTLPYGAPLAEKLEVLRCT